MAAGHDLLVVGELAVDEPAHQLDGVDVEDHLAPGRCQHDVHRVVRVGQDAHELDVRASGDDQAGVLDRQQHLERLDRDAVVVGRGEGQPVAREAGQDAGQDRARLVAGGREGDLRERLAQHLLADAGGGSLAGRRDDRELVRVDAPKVRLIAPGA